MPAKLVLLHEKARAWLASLLLLGPGTCADTPPFSTGGRAAKGSAMRPDGLPPRPTIEYESGRYRSGGYYSGPHVLGRLDHSPCRVPCGSETVVDGEGSTP